MIPRAVELPSVVLSMNCTLTKCNKRYLTIPCDGMLTSIVLRFLSTTNLQGSGNLLHIMGRICTSIFFLVKG